MCNYDKSKIYPDLDPTAAQDPETYHLKNQLKLRYICLMKFKFVKGW